MRCTPILAGFVIALGCGASPPPPAPAPVAPVIEEGAGDVTEDGDGASDPIIEVVEDEGPLPDAPCAELDVASCRAAVGRCVWDRACRDPVDGCEAVAPDPSWNGEPVFASGDPCERARAGCAWSPSTGRCAPFVATTACPATLAEARAATVYCTHPSQPELACRYGGTRCSCAEPIRCPGGAHPPPSMDPPPSAFTCVPPIDERGCPTSGIRAGAPCRLSADVVCMSCSTAATCVSGRWRVRRLPPRP